MRNAKFGGKGISLVEVLLVIAALGILILLLANLPNSIRLIGRARNQSLAREIAAKGIEDVRATQYTNLTNGQVNLTDSRINLLPAGSGVRLIEDCAPTICTQGERVKQVTLTITWNDLGNSRNVILKTLVAEGGLNQ